MHESETATFHRVLESEAVNTSEICDRMAIQCEELVEIFTGGQTGDVLMHFLRFHHP
jgi:hypothetical protein